MDQVEYQKIKSYAEKNNLTLSKACVVANATEGCALSKVSGITVGTDQPHA